MQTHEKETCFERRNIALDRLAALWPFLGIVGVVLVLVIVILIAEARAKKTTRRPLGNDEDENDHANDP